MSSQEQPEDQRPDDQAEADDGDGPDAGAATDGAESTADGDDASDGAESTADGDADGDDGADAEDKPPTDEERLEQLGERIDKARSQAEEAGVLVDEEEAEGRDVHGEEEFVESGASDDQDDQTIAPPG